MSDRIERSISESLEVDRHLLPHMPFLLQDLWALGSSVDHIVDIVDSFNLPENAQILDLGCGKGAVLIQIAAKYGFEVTGIDVMDAFLEDVLHSVR